MNKREFDEIIKHNIVLENGVDSFGYVIDNKNYPLYYQNEVFSDFIYQMKTDYNGHYRKYSDGKGSELIPKIGRYGWLPPGWDGASLQRPRRQRA